MESNILLTKYIPSDKNASQKAPEDIEKIFSSHFGQTFRVRYTDNLLCSYIDTIKEALKIRFFRNKTCCNLFVQWPLYVKRPLSYKIFVSSRFKNKIVLIHDLDSLRFHPENHALIYKEIESLNHFDYVIAHNEKMKKWLIENGLRTNVLTLDIFDYLLESKVEICHSKNYELVVAGNLNKSNYLKDIDKILSRQVNAYGVLPSYTLPSNLKYEGSFTPNELPRHIKGEFGLIWDGDNINSCSGTNGNYLHYNNPHKLSLYIACGLPVIVWEEAAIADFVKINKIGFAVKSLSEIDRVLDALSYERYNEMVSNVSKISSGVICGENTIRAFEEILN